MEEGNTPYVTTTSFDNGVKSFVNEDPIYNKYALSVSLNGSVGEVFSKLMISFQIQIMPYYILMKNMKNIIHIYYCMLVHYLKFTNGDIIIIEN